jgi:hypothetical protein
VRVMGILGKESSKNALKLPRLPSLQVAAGVFLGGMQMGKIDPQPRAPACTARGRKTELSRNPSLSAQVITQW